MCRARRVYLAREGPSARRCREGRCWKGRCLGQPPPSQTTRRKHSARQRGVALFFFIRHVFYTGHGFSSCQDNALQNEEKKLNIAGSFLAATWGTGRRKKKHRCFVHQRAKNNLRSGLVRSRELTGSCKRTRQYARNISTQGT